MRKFLDSKVINSLGWKPKFNLKQGLINTYKYFLKINVIYKKISVFIIATRA